MSADDDTVIRTRPAITSTIVVLALLCAAIAAGRLRFIRDLPDWDVATYALIGDEMAHGQRLYADIWDMKPPGIFASFALAEWITRGSHEWSAYILSVAAAVATTLAMYVAGASFSRATGLWAAALWTCVSLHPALGGYRPNTESFVNAFVAIGVAVWLSHRRTMLGAIVSGCAFAIASLYKQVAIAPAAAMVIWKLCDRRDSSHARAAMHSLLMFLMIPLAWFVVAAYFVATSRGGLFYDTTIVYSRFYSGNISTNVLAALRPSHLFPRATIELLPLVMLAITGIFLCRQRGLLIALSIGAFVAVAMPGQFFEHYYQLWLITFSLAAACAITWMPRRWSVTTGLIACIGLAILQAHWWVYSPRDRAAAQYPASFFLNVADVGKDIRRILNTEETMFVWGDEPQLYWLADKRPRIMGLWKMHVTQGPMSPLLTEQTLRGLEENPPDLVVVWASDPDLGYHRIGTWILANYEPIPNNRNRFPIELYGRKGSQLLRRLNQAALP